VKLLTSIEAIILLTLLIALLKLLKKFE